MVLSGLLGADVYFLISRPHRELEIKLFHCKVVMSYKLPKTAIEVCMTLFLTCFYRPSYYHYYVWEKSEEERT